MARKTLVRIAVIVAVVLFASLSGAKARQVWGESQAQSARDAARTQAVAAVRKARIDGVKASRLTDLQRRIRWLDSTRAPQSELFVGMQREGFFDRQARSFRQITRNAVAVEAGVTKAAFRWASHSLHYLSARLALARSLGVDAPKAGPIAAAQQRRLRQRGTADKYWQIAATANAAVKPLNGSIAARQTVVAGIVSAAGGTKDGVVSLAATDASTGRAQVSLLQSFTKRANDYSKEIDSRVAAVNAAPDARSAAIQDALLRDTLTLINADFLKTLPAKVIVVSTEDQWAWMYENGTKVYDTPVTTGGPDLPTDHGVFHIYMKASPFEFHSPWPEGNPYYYPPTPVQFWMPFDGGQGLHDASWRSNFGPGSNLEPTDLGTGYYILGTHGCVNLPYDAASFVWNWAPVGTTVVVE